MSKKRDKERLERMTSVYDAIFNEIEDMSRADVQRALADTGADREELRARFHEVAKDLAHRLRVRGDGAPHYLTRVLEQHADATHLPVDRNRAFAKAKQYLTALLGPPSYSGGLEIVGAYRGEGDLTDADRKTIDEIDAELRCRAEAEEDEESKA
jgi:hypothetical protein